MNNVCEKIATYLLEDEFFVDFRLRKNDSTIICKLPDGFEKVELQNWIDTNYSSGEKELVIHPIYGRRFNVLHKWFEKFSFKSISDQRGSYSIGFDGDMLGKRNGYRLPPSENHTYDWDICRSEIVANASFVFGQFSTLTDLYKYLVYPAVIGEKDLPDVSADWVFQYLLLTKIVDGNNYAMTKKVILDQVEKMNARHEPNITRYYSNMDDILNFLENVDVNLTSNPTFKRDAAKARRPLTKR